MADNGHIMLWSLLVLWFELWTCFWVQIHTECWTFKWNTVEYPKYWTWNL